MHPRSGGADIFVCRFRLLSLIVAFTAYSFDVQAQLDPGLLVRAEKLLRDKPTPDHLFGVIELRRILEIKPPSFRATDLPKPSSQRDAIVEAMAWRMIPLPATDRHQLDALLDAWAKAG